MGGRNVGHIVVRGNDRTPTAESEHHTGETGVNERGTHDLRFALCGVPK